MSRTGAAPPVGRTWLATWGFGLLVLAIMAGWASVLASIGGTDVPKALWSEVRGWGGVGGVGMGGGGWGGMGPH